MDEIIKNFKEILKRYSDIELYTSYDAIPVKDKERFFTVISVTKYETFDPIYSESYFYIPVNAEIKLTVLAPQGSSADELFDYYNKYIADAINHLSKIKNGMRNMSVAPDTVSKRLALTAVFHLDAIKSIRRIERW